jgi:hypothetical protein
MSRSRVSTALVAVLSLTGVGFLAAAAVAADVPTMTKEELRAKLGDPNVVVVDARTGRDWKTSDVKIKGAARGNPVDVAAWAGKYPKDKTLVLYCA